MLPTLVKRVINFKVLLKTFLVYPVLIVLLIVGLISKFDYEEAKILISKFQPYDALEFFLLVGLVIFTFHALKHALMVYAETKAGEKS